MKTLTDAVRDLAHEIERDRENQAHEYEKLLLRLEVALLRSERRNLTGQSDQSLLEDSTPPISQE